MANENFNNQEEALASQIGSMGADTNAANTSDAANTQNASNTSNASPMENKEAPIAEQDQQSSQSMVGQKLQFFGKRQQEMRQDANDFAERHNLNRVGDNIFEKASYREGWIDVDRALLGERSIYYPEDWTFRIKPATVEAIRNWSTLDEESANSIDVVFDEVLKACLAINTPQGPLPWNQINSWDRFFFILLIREYTFKTGEYKVSFKRECPNCESDIEFTLNSQALMYDMPGEDVLQSYDRDKRCWIIYPEEYDVPRIDEGPIVLYLPTREKDANIRAWLVDRLQQDRNAKIDRVFMKFLPWLCPKISKDVSIAKNQIRKAEIEFKSWDIDMFELMDDVLKNITVTPSTELIARCPSCGEEATAPIQFPNGVSSLFHTNRERKKFGKK